MAGESKIEKAGMCLNTSRIPPPYEYEQAHLTLVRIAVRALVSQDSFVGDIPVKKTKHAGRLRHVHGDAVMDRRSDKSEVPVTVARSDLAQMDVPAYTEYIYRIADGQLAQLVPALCETMAQATEFTGRALPVDEAAFSWDSYLLALERMEIRFEDDGSYDLPRLFVHPELARKIDQMPLPPDFENHFEQMIRKKKEEWIASQRTRRLPR